MPEEAGYSEAAMQSSKAVDLPSSGPPDDLLPELVSLTLQTERDGHTMEPKTEMSEVKVPSLSELLHVARKERDQAKTIQRKLADTTRIQVVLAEQRRLAIQARDCRQLLVQCIRSEKKDTFRSLYYAFGEAAADLEPPEDVPNWFDGLLPASQSSLCDFLSRLRYDGDYLGSLLAAIPQRTLQAMLPQDSRDSVLGPTRDSLSTDRALADLVDPSGATVDALVLLTHADLSATATGVWATACARLIIDQRPVHERLIVHLLNLWAGRSANHALELWFTDTLRNGSAFVRKATFSQRMNPVDDAKEAFFDDALGKLLALILDSIPAEVLRFCSAIRRKLLRSPKHYSIFPSFAATKWLLLSYLPRLLLYPESFGILLDHHIPEASRTRILKDLCDRAQRVIFEVINPWPHQQIHPGHAASVKAIIAAFTVDLPDASTRRSSQVAISGQRLLSSLRALSTSSRADSASTLHPGLHSSASSVSGFSLFRRDSALPIEQPESRIDECTIQHELKAIHDDLADVLSANDEPAWSVFTLDDAKETLSPLQVETFTVDRLSHTPLIDQPPSPQELSDISNMVLTGSVLSDGASYRTESTGVLTAQSSKTSMTSIPEWTDVARKRTRPQPEGAWLSEMVHLITSADFSHEGDSCQTLITATRAAIEQYQRQGQHYEALTLVRHLQRFETHDRSALNLMLHQRYASFLQTTIKQHSFIDRLHCLDNTEDLAQIRRVLRWNDHIFKELRFKIWYAVDVRSSAIYERLSDIVIALRAMKQTTRTSTMQARTTNHILDLLSVPAQSCGPNKLSDAQCLAVRSWLARNRIDMLCVEERIHKLCMEVRNAVEELTKPSPTENPMLWSESLFDEERSRLLLSPRSLTTRASFWSLKSQPSCASIMSGSRASLKSHKPHAAYTAVLALVMSDVNIFNHGSETDRAMWHGLANDLPLDIARLDWPRSFDHTAALSHMLRSFSVTCNPMKKLEILHSMQKFFAPDPDAWASVFAEFRPLTLLRDLQYIASLLPASVLETHTSFWHACVGVGKLKRRLVQSMLLTADETIAFHTNNRKHRSSTAQLPRDAAFAHPPNEMSYTMTEAAALLVIAAKEGESTAQRELATLYLTHPELMQPVIAPLTPPRDVFRPEFEGRWQDKTRCDPQIMAVAHHWMMLSSKGGDMLAIEFIKQQEEMERLP